jgi:hypothetical protein
MTEHEQAHREQVEDAYYTASNNVDQLITSLEPQQVVNLLRQYLVGVFDVGVTESLSVEQVTGVAAWLEDLIETSKHLNLNNPAEPGEPPEWIDGRF